MIFAADVHHGEHQVPTAAFPVRVVRTFVGI